MKWWILGSDGGLMVWVTTLDIMLDLRLFCIIIILTFIIIHRYSCGDYEHSLRKISWENQTFMHLLFKLHKITPLFEVK